MKQFLGQIGKPMFAAILVVLSLWTTGAAVLDARPESEQKMVNDNEVKAKYENCLGDWCSDPRPGKARYARDPWKWVVTDKPMVGWGYPKMSCAPTKAEVVLEGGAYAEGPEFGYPINSGATPIVVVDLEARSEGVS